MGRKQPASVRQPLLSVRDLVRTLGDQVVLRLRSFDLYPGETVLIGGLSEGQADLLLHHLTGRFLPEHGSVRLFGINTASLTSEDEWIPLLSRCALFDLRQPLMEEWPVEVSLLWPLAMDLDRPMDEARYAEVHHIARAVGLTKTDLAMRMADADPEIRARVQIARCLALQPDLVFCLFPSRQLEPANLRVFLRLMRRFQKRWTVLIFDQPVRTYARGVDRILILDPESGDLNVRTSRRFWHRWKTPTPART